MCVGGEDTVSAIPNSLQVLTNDSLPKTASTIKSFFLAATLYPETVRLAQKELDSVVGRDRLPDFSDKPQLPYVSALVKEVLRLRPPTAFGTVFWQGDIVNWPS